MNIAQRKHRKQLADAIALQFEKLEAADLGDHVSNRIFVESLLMSSLCAYCNAMGIPMNEAMRVEWLAVAIGHLNGISSIVNN